MKKVRTMEEAYRVFELLGIKEVTKKWQRKKGTEVWELPFKTMYDNVHLSVNRFSIYKSGYVRKMVVYGKNDASMSCYQLNLVRQKPEYFKDYKWNEDFTKQTWTGKYRKRMSSERVMIDNHRDRVIYLCNYILKNYYRKKDVNLVGKYTRKRVKSHYDEWRKTWKQDNLPFFDADEGKWRNSPNVDDVKVIINGQRYNLT